MDRDYFNVTNRRIQDRIEKRSVNSPLWSKETKVLIPGCQNYFFFQWSTVKSGVWNQKQNVLRHMQKTSVITFMPGKKEKKARFMLHTTYFVSLATRILHPSGMTSPRWLRNLQLVGPQCGHTWVSGCITENLICTKDNKFTFISLFWKKKKKERHNWDIKALFLHCY